MMKQKRNLNFIKLFKKIIANIEWWNKKKYQFKELAINPTKNNK